MVPLFVEKHPGMDLPDSLFVPSLSHHVCDEGARYCLPVPLAVGNAKLDEGRNPSVS